MTEEIKPPGSVPRPEPGSGRDESRRLPRIRARCWSAGWAIGDANSGGFVHGGAVMRLVDEAAGLAAINHSRPAGCDRRMDRMTFNTPVVVGELCALRAR